MDIHLTRGERLLLLTRFTLRQDTRERLTISTHHPVTIWLTVEEADELREAAQDLLQTEGFGADYAPTQLGAALEVLIDKLFTG